MAWSRQAIRSFLPRLIESYLLCSLGKQSRVVAERGFGYARPSNLLDFSTPLSGGFFAAHGNRLPRSGTVRASPAAAENSPAATVAPPARPSGMANQERAAGTSRARRLP
jgi:hypothetical protein